MSLNSFPTASALIQAMVDGPQFVQINSGAKNGTVARVVKVISRYYSVHDYQLEVQGRRPFWAKGNELEHLPDWQGDTVFVVNNEVPCYNDLMGRPIGMGNTILFPRGTEGARVDMVMGTVRKISAKGVIYVKPFKNSEGGQLSEDLMRVGKPTSAMIIDNGTINQVMLAKLSIF